MNFINKILGIDLSIRSTGLCLLTKSSYNYSLIQPNDKLKDEEVINHNSTKILEFITEYNPTHIGIEGLSHNSISSSKDLIAGNFWHLRTEIFKLNKNLIVDIIPVKSWREPLFTKEERKQLRENEKLVKKLKADIKQLSKSEKTKILLENEDLIKHGNIKYLTWEKLPEPMKSDFETLGFSHGAFDISDSYFIAKYVFDKYIK